MTSRDEDEKPLDPVQERLRRKMVRLLATSIGIMFIGVMAVLAAVVYKLSTSTDVKPGAMIALDLPAGASIEDMALDGDRALLRLRTSAGEELRLISLADGSLIERITLAPQTPR
ncbi:fimbrial protein [Aurantimonas sp. VKM B-3413]|uniref:fimbrial protein n=1 Tax=Aurantimonas sp. VKM B-3413 TaxID=2779401 RepID=UPI001E4ECA50|nr:fimbrial protein [Aurantimonas sp. VKM B-3413]MCB8837974.1 fimbrial protein [Aurantimonas sp. VKM B-3413]